MINYELTIQNENSYCIPVTAEGIEWSTERKGAPGKLTFQIKKDAWLTMVEGNRVHFAVGGKLVFLGYIFRISFDKTEIIRVTCYDQLRYFKNKDTYIYEGKTAGQLLQMLCSDFQLKTGKIADTEYVIAKKAEQNKTLFDMMQGALEATLLNTKRLYTLYDAGGAITLENLEDMKVPILIDEETGENFDFTSSIDSNTYNQIKLTYDNEESGKRDVYIAKDTSHIKEWGLLQFYETLQQGENGRAKADELLGFYNVKSKNLSIKGAFGDVRVRAGSSIFIKLHLGDTQINHMMVCDNVTHKFESGIHQMDLTLIGGNFIA